MMAGWAVGLGLISTTADRKGRMRSFMRMTVFQVLMTGVLIIFITSLPSTGEITSNPTLITFGILLFLFGVARSNNIVGLLLLVEHLPKIHTIWIVTCFNFIEGLSVFSWVLMFIDQGAENKFSILIWLVLAVQIVALIWAYRNLWESPVWLMSNGYNKRLRSYFEFLSKQNKSEEMFNNYVAKHNYTFENKDEEVFEVHTREDSFKGAIINNSQMRKNFILMMFFWISTSCIYFIIVLYPRTYLSGQNEVVLVYAVS